MKSPKIKGIGEVATEYGAKVMKVIKKGLLGRSLFDFYGDVKTNALRVKESSNVPLTPNDKDGGIVYVKNADGKLYYKSNEVAEVELSAHTGLSTEEVQDIAGALVATGGTKTGIAVTYQDATGDVDFVVDHDAATNFVAEEHVDWAASGAGTIHTDNYIENVVQTTVTGSSGSCTGNAATATALVTGNQIITGNLTVNASSSTGNPLLTFTQNGTRRAFIQLADNSGGYTNNLRINSEYGAITLGAASTDGSDSDTAYFAIEPTGIFKFGAVDSDATLTTDGNMTFRIDADNDETGQGFAWQNNASTEIASLDEGGNLSITGNILPGITYVKILPSDFMPDDGGRPAMIDDTSGDRWLESHGTLKLFAFVEIPLGFKATLVDIYGSATSAITVYEADVNSATVTSKGTGNIGTQINITDVTADATNYIMIELAQASGEKVYGGSMTIAAV